MFGQQNKFEGYDLSKINYKNLSERSKKGLEDLAT
jgi:hypothetical protein